MFKFLKGYAVFGLTKRPEVRFWEALLENEVGTVRELLNDNSRLADAPPPARVCRAEEGLDGSATPLHISAERGYSHIIKLLLLAGAMVDSVTDDGATPLHVAAAAGQLEPAELLIYRQADVNAKDQHGRTPLHRAALAGHETMVQLLINHNAQTDVVDHEGNTMLHCMAAGGCERMIEKLLEQGAQVDACNIIKQRTPLHVAVVSADHTVSSRIIPDRREARAKMERIVQLLLDYGADANAVDATGATPLDLFDFIRGDDESDPLVRLLRRYGGHWARYQHRHQDSGEPQDTMMQYSQAAPPAGEAQAAPGRANTNTTAVASEKRTAVGPPIELRRGPIVIGRQSGCDVRYRSRTLSRRHAEITCEHGEYIIRDLGSHNGVLINDQRIHAPHLLTPGEKIGLGVYEFEFDGRRLIPLTEELSEEELAAELSR